MIARLGPKRPFKHFLREWREARHLTQEQLADRLDTGKDQVSRWENGKRGMTIEVQVAIAEALQIEPADLFRDPAAPSIDALLANSSADMRRKAFEIVRVMISEKRDGTNG